MAAAYSKEDFIALADHLKAEGHSMPYIRAIVGPDVFLEWMGERGFMAAANPSMGPAKAAAMIAAVSTTTAVVATQGAQENPLPSAHECGAECVDPCAHKHPPSVPTTPCGAAESAEEGGRTATFAYEGPATFEGGLKWHRWPAGSGYVAKGPSGVHFTITPIGSKWVLKVMHGAPAVKKGLLVGEYGTVKQAKLSAEGWRGDVTGPEAPPTAPKQSGRGPAVAGPSCIPIVTLKRDGERYAECLKAAQALGPIDNSLAVYKLLHKQLLAEDQEVFVVVSSDVRGQLRGAPIEVARGQRSKVDVGIVDIMRAVMAAGGERFFVCHNHPSGIGKPSKEDTALTEAIRAAAKPFAEEIVFGDHLVIGTNEYYSFHDKKLHKVK